MWLLFYPQEGLPKGATLGRPLACSCGFYQRDQVNVAVTSWESEWRPEQYVSLGVELQVMSECIQIAHEDHQPISSPGDQE
jgi:hypothetical protein